MRCLSPSNRLRFSFVLYACARARLFLPHRLFLRKCIHIYIYLSCGKLKLCLSLMVSRFVFVPHRVQYFLFVNVFFARARCLRSIARARTRSTPSFGRKERMCARARVDVSSRAAYTQNWHIQKQSEEEEENNDCTINIISQILKISIANVFFVFCFLPPWGPARDVNGTSQRRK